MSSICFYSSFLLARFREFKEPTCFLIIFSKAFSKGEGENANLACSMICL